MRGDQSGCSQDFVDMVLLLLAYFNEKEDAIFCYVEDTCLAGEIHMDQVPLQEKNQDIAAEISKLKNQIKKFSIDEADYLHVVEQNKTLAYDIKDLEANSELLKKMDILQEEMDLLVKQKEDYEAELAHNNDKSEMLRLYKELTAKCKTLQAEKEMKQRIHQFRDYMKEYDMLKMREEKLDQLLASVEIAKAVEQEKFPRTQENIASLSKLCYSYIRNCCMDSETAEKLKKMMTLVVNNSTKAIQSESSARRLAPEIELLCQDLKRVHTGKAKLSSDLSSLKEQTSNVESELGTHRTQRRITDKSEKKLQEECELLTKCQRYFRQYLQFDSHHPLEHKLGVIKTLQHWAKEIPTTSQGRKNEQDHIKTALKTCGHPDWAFTKT
ncbi:hypothetical protein D4764_04G0013970 [Takifugu flavidus]|uniref:Helix-turn-helix domain-containing protein n=1 Tax=Takifugu flavidus TaxID=433684 RepID=A0A5C6NA53_9TELE|nr:hypothetical protein D4764_04G0013970 [Takifugu flavidus]